MFPIYWWAIALILGSYVQIALYGVNEKTGLCLLWILGSGFSDTLCNRAKKVKNCYAG